MHLRELHDIDTTVEKLPGLKEDSSITSDAEALFQWLLGQGGKPTVKNKKPLVQPVLKSTANEAVKRLLGLINFSMTSPETEVIRQRLIQKGVKPTLTNIKKHLIGHLLIPMDEVPDPERTIILRSGRPERFGIHTS